MERTDNRREEAKYYTELAEELRERFRSGFLAEFVRLRQPQFVLWRHQPQPDGTLRQLPFDPKTGRRANSFDPASWGRADQALKRLTSGFYNGLGIMLTKKDPRYPAKQADPFAAIALRGCTGTNRTCIDSWAREVMEFLKTHTHYTDHAGLNLLMEVGEQGLPGPEQTVNLTPAKFRRLEKPSIEFTDRNRFLPISPQTVTGMPQAIEKRRIEAGYLYFTFVPPELWPKSSEH